MHSDCENESLLEDDNLLTNESLHYNEDEPYDYSLKPQLEIAPESDNENCMMSPQPMVLETDNEDIPVSPDLQDYFYDGFKEPPIATVYSDGDGSEYEGPTDLSLCPKNPANERVPKNGTTKKEKKSSAAISKRKKTSEKEEDCKSQTLEPKPKKKKYTKKKGNNVAAKVSKKSKKADPNDVSRETSQVLDLSSKTEQTAVTTENKNAAEHLTHPVEEKLNFEEANSTAVDSMEQKNEAKPKKKRAPRKKKIKKEEDMINSSERPIVNREELREFIASDHPKINASEFFNWLLTKTRNTIGSDTGEKDASV